MGCCASRNESYRNEVPLSDTQTLDTQPYRLQEGARQSVDLNVAGLQVEISSAGWVSGVALSELVTVVTLKDILLVTFFDWHGNPSTASYCTQNIKQVFLDLIGLSNDIEHAMRNLLKELDARIHSSKQMNAEEKASSAASGCIVALDVRKLRFITVRSGGSAVAVGRLVHGLATQLTEAAFIHRPESPLGGSGALKSAAADKSTCIGGSSSLKACKGEGNFEPIQEQPVTVYHEQIILGSAGLWQTLTADDAALRSHFLLKASSGNSQQRGANALKRPNVATQLITYAQAQSARYESQGWTVLPCNLTSVVITLKWPATSLNQAFPKEENFLDSLAQQMHRESPEGHSRARLGWRRIRMLHVEFVRARRHALRRKWLDVVAAAVKQGKAKARQLEEIYWAKYQAAVTVTVSGKVIDSKGKAFMPTRLEAKAC